MSEQAQETKYCWQGEFAHCADDCGSMYCELTGATWNEWNYEEGSCDSCPFGIWNEEDWREVMEEA